MTPKQLATQIRNLLRLLIDSEVAAAAKPVIEQKFGPILRITWASTDSSSQAFYSSRFATLEEYRSFVDANLYSAILYDGALVQMSYDFIGHKLAGHRLCYYPCPFDIDPELIRSEPIGDLIGLYSDSANINVNLRTPCRFDYDAQNVAVGHPSVHMHLNTPECRWPVTHPVSVGEFIKFVFRHFYPNLWAAHDFLRNWPHVGRRDRTIAIEEETELHVSCGQARIDNSLEAV